jgi:hypothetical protein
VATEDSFHWRPQIPMLSAFWRQVSFPLSLRGGHNYLHVAIPRMLYHSL